MSIAVIVPSRGRPQNIVALIEAWEATTLDKRNTELHVMVDDDDPEIDGYRSIKMRPGSTLWIGPRRRLGGSLNHLAPALAGTPWKDYLPVNGFDVIGFMGDDHRPRTEDWDHTVDEIAKRTPASVIYGNDLIQGAALPTAVFMDARIVRALGWFVVPGMTHLFMDNLWKTLGEQLGTLRYLPDVIIEHVHPIAGKAEWDQGYQEANDGAVWEHDEAIYREWVAFQMPADIAKIRDALNPGRL